MRYFIHLAYNGTNYCGWQTQPNLPTVQLTIEQALSTLLRQPIAIVGCGRTDTGVHASDFYAHFDFPSPNAPSTLDTDQLTFKLNNILPPDIAIFRIFPSKTMPTRVSMPQPAPINTISATNVSPSPKASMAESTTVPTSI